MIKPYIEMTSIGLLIRDANSGVMLTEILRHDYLDLRNGIYSDWILHLSSKSWITIPILHELADIFRKEYPQNNIDWKETLRAAEGIYGRWN